MDLGELMGWGELLLRGVPLPAALGVVRPLGTVPVRGPPKLGICRRMGRGGRGGEGGRGGAKTVWVGAE